MLLFLFPFAAPLLRLLAAALPDAGFRRVLAARLTVQDVALRLIADHRRVLAQVIALGCLGSGIRETQSLFILLHGTTIRLIEAKQSCVPALVQL